MLTKTHYIAFAALVLVLVASAALGFVFWEVHNAGKELESKVASIAERNAKVKMYTELSRLIEESEDERAELGTYVLTEDKTSAFLTEIEALGTRLGITLTTLSLSVAPQEGEFDNLQIEFSLQGTERAVKSMLSLLESLPYHSNLSSVSMVREGSNNLRATVKLSVSLSKYAQ